MKQELVKFTITLFVVLSLLSNCKKSDNNINVEIHEIEYRIVNPNLYFTEITYNGSNGEPIVLYDLSTFQNGSKKITISSKPFNAKITAVEDNTTSSALNYSLHILVDGVIKKVVDVQVPAMSIATQSAEYLYQ